MSALQLNASNSTQRELINCKWHRNPNRCNNAPGCIHNGINCIIDTSVVFDDSCSLYHRRRRMCRTNNGCYFDLPTRTCLSITKTPTLEPTSLSIDTESPSMEPSPSGSTSFTTDGPSVFQKVTERPSATPTVQSSGMPSVVSSIGPSSWPSAASSPFTQKPTVLRRSQDYCRKYDKRPRRCTNRGCLFDDTARLCTNGVPTSTPSVSPTALPSVSPSIQLTTSPQPTETPYRVRLYWEQGYKWQEDPTEKWFCWACARCRECTDKIQYRTDDCVDLLCDVKHYCSEGMNIAVADCDPNQRHDKSASFSFLTRHNDDLQGGQIQVHNTNLCLSLAGIRSIELDKCDASKIEQRFEGFHPNEGAMEISPVNVTMEDGEVVEQCITQHHHPRVGERIFSEKCSRARRSDTNLWDLWTVL